MPILNSELRTILEKAVIEARDVAEASARSVLTVLAVDQKEAPVGMSPEQRRLRNSLRAKGRQLGGGLMTDGIDLLLEDIAYQQWHRMLFARFLAENNLLVHPTEGVPVTLHDCGELAKDEGEPDLWGVAAKYASVMLPGIFQNSDPSVQVRFAPEGRSKLESILTNLPVIVFTGDDGLGWIYQFWQSKRKDEVNKSGEKIGGVDLAPVTQLFTEDYMVRFLLENSLGAWWAARHPDSPLLRTFSYLRFRNDSTPVAGSFSGWPSKVAEITIMDPCCGSGHFLVAAFEMLRRMRMEEEGIGDAEAADAVIRHNLFGLEIDERCVQIATFALALSAWKYGGYHEIPLPNIACSGIAVQGQLDTWTRLANGDENLKHTLERLYSLFSKASELGSLIDPTNVPIADRMFTPDYDHVAPVLEKALTKERNQDDPVAAVFGVAAEGVARAARILAGRYTLINTNVPFLARGKQSDLLKQNMDVAYPLGKADLATAFVERCLAFAQSGGSIAIVTPQNWLFLGAFKNLRVALLEGRIFNLAVRLGPAAFHDMNWWAAKTALVVITNSVPSNESEIGCIDVSPPRDPTVKAALLTKCDISIIRQARQLRNPDARLLFAELEDLPLLQQYASAFQGIATGDYSRFGRCFWELPSVQKGWEFQQSTVLETAPYSGREHIFFWENGKGALASSEQARIQGLDALGKQGIVVSQMNQLPVTLFTGEFFDNNCSALVVHDPDNWPAVWAFCSSGEFRGTVREIDQALKVTNASLAKVPFDLGRWQQAAVNGHGDGIPKPWSRTPTQWLFNGRPVGSNHPLQVAVARLLGYQWPRQTGSSFRDCPVLGEDGLELHADPDGMACLSATGTAASGVERLRSLLAAAYGSQWSPSKQEELLASVGFGGGRLEEWLRDSFFEEHCRIFYNRPFIWHIWDGRRDGFSILVNYHRFNRVNLDKLIYTHLGAWIRQQREKAELKEPGADGRLVAALELQKRLEKIREGESPYDIYVRWKNLDEQPIGWNPDLNDGVRLNIRPFVEAGVLRTKFVINWKKDRGNNLDGSERINDQHFTIAEKLAARGSARGKN